MAFSKRRNRCLSMVAVVLFLGVLAGWAQAPTPAPAQATPAPAQAAPAPAAPAAAAPAMDVPLDVKAAQPPSTDELAKGDPGGTKTGTVSDVVAEQSGAGCRARAR